MCHDLVVKAHLSCQGTRCEGQCSGLSISAQVRKSVGKVQRANYEIDEVIPEPSCNVALELLLFYPLTQRGRKSKERMINETNSDGSLFSSFLNAVRSRKILTAVAVKCEEHVTQPNLCVGKEMKKTPGRRGIPW